MINAFFKFPYKVGRFEPGRYIEYERVKDWWGADLPAACGQNNFDVIRYEYYRDRDWWRSGCSPIGATCSPGSTWC